MENKDMAEVFLLLGSNKGDKLENLNNAILFTQEKIGKIKSQSSIYVTDTWGAETNAYFVNQIIQVKTKLLPKQLLTAIKEYEKWHRKEFKTSSRYGLREIDIDIIFYDSLVINQEDLIIPHPRLQHRNFALVPLCELVPDMIHPQMGKSLLELQKDCNDKCRVRKFAG